MVFRNSVDDYWKHLFQTKVDELSIPGQYYLFRMFVRKALELTENFSLETKMAIMGILESEVELLKQVDKEQFYGILLMDLELEKLREQAEEDYE